jgi:hypothetical protein
MALVNRRAVEISQVRYSKEAAALKGHISRAEWMGEQENKLQRWRKEASSIIVRG